MDDGNSLKLKEIGNRIRAARVEQHMSQDALAFEADLSLSTMSDIELGKSNLRVVTLIKIIEALKISADTILRPDVPNVNGIYQSEFSADLSDCSPAEMESIIRLVSDVKKNFPLKQTITHTTSLNQVAESPLLGNFFYFSYVFINRRSTT